MNISNEINKKSVSIIIPNYNGRHLLEKYLPFTLQAINNAGVDFEVIVIDDCSSDDSVAYLQGNYPLVKLICNSVNKGFSFSCNQGIAAAQKELALILNSDVKLSANYFDPLWAYFANDSTFGVMGRIIDMGGTRIQDAARMPKENVFKLKTAWFYYLAEGGPAYTFYLSGANALIDLKKLKEIGGFNELFSPFYCEDFDLGLRAWRLNWKCFYEHEAICEHEVSASTKDYKTSNWVKMIYFRNRYYLHALHLNGFRLLFWFLQITFVDLVPKIIARKLWLGKSYWSFLTHIGAIRTSRKQFRNLMNKHHSTTGINEVVRHIIASVHDQSIIRIN